MKKTVRTTFVLIAMLMLFAIGCSQQPVACETIYEAASAGNLTDVKRHLQKGTVVNAKNEYGWTPLMRAAGQGHLDVVKFLVSKGADVNAKNNDGETPLIVATAAGKQNVVEFLKQHGAKE